MYLHFKVALLSIKQVSSKVPIGLSILYIRSILRLHASSNCAVYDEFDLMLVSKQQNEEIRLHSWRKEITKSEVKQL